MKNECMLSLNRQQVQQVGDYCASHSTSLPTCIVEHARTTAQQTEREGEMATSFAQCSWMMGIIKTIKPRRILEVGTFTGLSSLAFYEATRDTGAEIITVDVCDEFIQIALKAFEKYGVTDRVKQVKGSFPDVVKELGGEFDFVYIDGDQMEFEAYVRPIIDRRLLSQRGVLLADDVLLFGVCVDENMSDMSEPDRDWCKEAAVHMNAFNKWVSSDSRLDATLIPVFNGVMQITWKH